MEPWHNTKTSTFKHYKIDNQVIKATCATAVSIKIALQFDFKFANVPRKGVGSPSASYTYKAPMILSSFKFGEGGHANHVILSYSQSVRANYVLIF